LFNGDQFINQLELRKMVLDVLDIKNENKLLIEQPMMPPPGAQPGQGGGGPNPPQPPEPGQKALPAERQMAEMARVAGGGLVKQGGPAMPQQAEG
jgi:hypothetical protein